MPAQSRKLVLIKSNWVFSCHVLADLTSRVPAPFPPTPTSTRSRLQLVSVRCCFSSFPSFRFLHVAFACEWGKVNSWASVWVLAASVSEWIATHAAAGTWTRTHLTLTRRVYMRHWAAPWHANCLPRPLPPCVRECVCVRPFFGCALFARPVDWNVCWRCNCAALNGRGATCGGFAVHHIKTLGTTSSLAFGFYGCTLQQCCRPIPSLPLQVPLGRFHVWLNPLSRQCVMYGRSVCGHAVDTRINMT